MKTPSRSVNAWIFLLEDEPEGTSYNSPSSCYQSLITHAVYGSTDILSICWVDTVVTGPTTVPLGDGSSCTIELQSGTHPDGSTNLEYLQWVVRDARQVNPNIKILIMLGYAEDEINRIFSSDESQWQRDAAAFASNLVAFLQQYGLDGFDVDWEAPLSDGSNKIQFALLFTAIRAAFDAQDGPYYLTLSPADVGQLDAATVNAAFDFVTLQNYSGFTEPQSFIQAGVSKSLLGYGAKFEPADGTPIQDAQGAYQAYLAGGYAVTTQWRLNSNDFPFEQAQQMIYHQLIYGPTGPSFDDTPIIGAAGDPSISQLVVRSGEVLDSIQATSPSPYSGLPYCLPQHGGDGGTASTVTIPPGDAVVEVSGYTGAWFGWDCVLQISIRTRNGSVFGPFGSMANSSSPTPFRLAAPQGQSIVAFNGSVINVPVAGGGTTDIIASLNASYA